MLNKKQIIEMLDVTYLINEKSEKDWITQNRDWSFAAAVEGVEFIEHIGWKWWKSHSKDLAQAHMELVDIWHFGLSKYMSHKNRPDDPYKSIDLIAGEISDEIKHFIDIGHFGKNNQSTKDLTKAFIHQCTGILGFSMHHFLLLMASYGFTFDQLYKQYIGKNMLNLFRQDNGYKEGYYHKVWLGEEDNVHLCQILNSIEGMDGMQEQITYQLQERYNLQLNKSMAEGDV